MNLRDLARDEQGFTLIELLAVVAIIGVLAAIALPAFLGQADKARDATAKSDVGNAVSQMSRAFARSSSTQAAPMLPRAESGRQGDDRRRRRDV